MSTIDEFIRLAENRLANLGPMLAEAQRVGDIAAIARIESALVDVEQTLTQLRGL
jgi:hypothetical protein